VVEVMVGVGGDGHGGCGGVGGGGGGADEGHSAVSYFIKLWSPPRPERLWGPPNLLPNGYQGLFPWG
jgi:hypothetical protein